MVKTSLDRSKIRILLLEGVHASAVETLKSAGYSNIEYIETSLPDNELKQKIAQCHFIGIRSRTQLTEDVLACANKLIAIGCFCIGTNQVDVAAALSLGVPVFNAPFSNTRSVAELVLAEAIMLMRGVPEKSALAHQGIWKKSASNSYEVRGKTLGIVGYGNIGSQLSVLAESIGMKIKFYDIENKLPLGNAEQIMSLEKLLSISDIVTLHVPETAATKNMMAEKEFAAIKQGSVLINASRGTVVDIDALCKALSDKKIHGAAIDVFPTEPRSNKDEFISPLRGFNNVILTPHVGGSTLEAQENIGQEVAEKMIKYSDTGATTTSTNFPEVTLPAHPDNHRLLHIHKNVPGVMTQINRIFSENNINILGQYLMTNEKVGYVVIDVDAEYSELAISKLRKIEGTIRSRILF